MAKKKKLEQLIQLLQRVNIESERCLRVLLPIESLHLDTMIPARRVSGHYTSVSVE